MYWDELNSSNTRRLPIYLLIDVSATMAGARIEAVNQGLHLLYDELMQNPQAIDTVWMSVITFGSQAEVKVALTPITEFAVPQLTAGGATALGLALNAVVQSLNVDIHTQNDEEHRGDYRPLMFILTDGEPTDGWQEPLAQLNNHPYHPTNIIILSCGDQVHLETLKNIGNTVLMMNEVNSERLASFFKWVSVSVNTASRRSMGMIDPHSGEISLPTLPTGINKMD